MDSDSEEDAEASEGPSTSGLRPAGGSSGGEANEPAADAAEMRRPKRRRKQLHDLSGVGSVGITARGPLDKHRFNCFMRDLLGERARDIFRCKGLLCIKVGGAAGRAGRARGAGRRSKCCLKALSSLDSLSLASPPRHPPRHPPPPQGQESTKFVFQGVHETVCFGPAATAWEADEEPINQIVFIGRKLSRQDLVEGLRSCVWVPLPDGWVEHHDSRTNQPYFLNSTTGAKQWSRPTFACALVKGTETSHKQPRELQPRRSAEAETLTAVVTGA